MSPKLLALISSLVAAVLVFFAFKSGEKDSKISGSFNLVRGSYSSSAPEIMVSQIGNGTMLLQLNMEYYTYAIFDITFQEAELEGWCVHIGDSPSNDGWGGGDGGQFSNNAEMQITAQGGVLTLYGNDYLAEQNEKKANMMLAELDFVKPKDKVTIEVKDGAIAWDNHRGKKDTKQSEFLFALKGQPDAKHNGPNDKLIFAAFNRTVGNLAQTGKCVSAVKVTLLRQ